MKYFVIGMYLLGQVVLGAAVSAECYLGDDVWSPIDWGVLGDSVIWVGDFADYGGKMVVTVNYTNTSCVAAWDGDAWEVLAWTNRKAGPLKVYNDKLYVGGDFSTIGGTYIVGLAAWNGVSWSRVGGGVNSTVVSLGLFNNCLFAGGPFTRAGNLTVNSVARWNDTAWSALGSGLNELAHTFTIFDGRLIVGGFFTVAGGIVANRIAAWDGSTWSPLGSGLNDAVLASATYNGRVYAAGSFTTAGGGEINGLAAWDGSNWSSLGEGVSGGLTAITKFCEYDGDLIIAGSFDSAGGVPANGIAAWDGADWKPFGSDSGWGGCDYVRLGIYEDRLYAGLDMLDSTGALKYVIARWGKPVYEAGDANGDKTLTVGDAVYIVAYIFRGGSAPKPLPAADANGDGKITVGDAVYLVSYIFRGGLEPRCSNLSDAVTDIDGNVYQTMRIGDQVWMAKNLKVTHFRNGDPIPNVTDGLAWASTTTGAYCNYGNDEATAAVYGRIYNAYAAGDIRSIAPEGWHVASDAEWQTLIDYLGGDSVAGWKLKEQGTVHWLPPNNGTNECGFAALPGGYRGSNQAVFGDLGNYACFWTSTSIGGGYAWYRSISYDNPNVDRYDSRMFYGFSIRCVKD